MRYSIGLMGTFLSQEMEYTLRPTRPKFMSVRLQCQALNHRDTSSTARQGLAPSLRETSRNPGDYPKAL